METDVINIFILLILFQVKHFLADFPLQTPYMLNKFKASWGFVVPLLSHGLTHALGTLVISYMFTQSIYYSLKLAFLDLVVHSIMDRIKAGPKYLGRFKLDNKLFWWSLGLDQMVHHLTHYAIIYLIISHIS